MSFRIITISREFGSGGRTVGKQVAERLGVAYYDNELVTKIAKESGFAESFIKESGEYADASSSFGFGLNHLAGGCGMAVSDQVYIAQKTVIEKVAEESACVIVGRCADYILRDRVDCLNVFVHATPSFRADRIVRLYGERDEKPEKRLADKDKRRKTYYKYYTNQQWGLAKNYHICLESSTLGIEQCVDMIANLNITK